MTYVLERSATLLTGRSCTLLVGMQTSTATMENSVEIPYQAPPGSQASSRGEAKDSALLSSRDAGLLEPPERPQGPWRPLGQACQICPAHLPSPFSGATDAGLLDQSMPGKPKLDQAMQGGIELLSPPPSLGIKAQPNCPTCPQQQGPLLSTSVTPQHPRSSGPGPHEKESNERLGFQGYQLWL